MKKLRNVLFLVAAISGLVSCDLTTVPEDSMIPERYFTSAASLEQWLNNCYTQFDGYGIMEIEADDVIDQGFTAFFAGSRLPSTETWSWTMLRRINYLLEHADICPDKEAVAYYTALARFHRAYFYFEKVKRYGDIMWYDRVIGSTDTDLLYKARDDRGVVMDNILADLDAAIAGLAGFAQIGGIIHRVQADMPNGAGYTGIVIAYLAGLNPLNVVIVAILFGALQISAVAVQVSGVPSQIATMIQGSIMLFVIAGSFFNRYRLVRRQASGQKGGEA